MSPLYELGWALYYGLSSVARTDTAPDVTGEKPRVHSSTASLLLLFVTFLTPTIIVITILRNRQIRSEPQIPTNKQTTPPDLSLLHSLSPSPSQSEAMESRGSKADCAPMMMISVIFLLLIHGAYSFYLPGVAPEDFIKVSSQSL